MYDNGYRQWFQLMKSDPDTDYPMSVSLENNLCSLHAKLGTTTSDFNCLINLSDEANMVVGGTYWMSINVTEDGYTTTINGITSTRLMPHIGGLPL